MAYFMKLLKILVVFVLFYNISFAKSDTFVGPTEPACICEPGNRQFNETTIGKVQKCPKCYVFEYKFFSEQTWAPRICVKKLNSSVADPIFVVIRQSLSVTSFEVPLTFPDVSPYQDVCKTLCPLSNHPEHKDLPVDQEINVEISTSSIHELDFSLIVSNISHFILTEKETVSLTITPAKPFVMQYNMGKDLRSVRIEAMSKDESCMVLSIQDLQCPIHDTVEAFEHQGYHQTLTRQSGISISKKTFFGGKQFVVLLLKPTDDDCTEGPRQIVPHNRQKEVILSVTPDITDEEYYIATFGVVGFFFSLYPIIFVCLIIGARRRRNPEAQIIDSENPTIQTPDTENQSIPNYGSSDVEVDRGNITHPLREIPGIQNNADEADFDKLTDIDGDKNVFRRKTVLYVSDLSRTKEKYLREKSKLYSWNLLTIAIFYGIPVVQLVYINQGIVNLTGNQDLCYYNFLCSHHAFNFSDFNHILSNIGYVMLGILFLFLVWRRESLSIERKRITGEDKESTGIPMHYGLMYAMGWALVMEGVLSASYHVCPNRANFQFDTAFMYVIATICMLKLYQARHADISAQSHTTWMMLAVVIIISFIGVTNGGIIIWILYTFAHLSVVFIVSAKIYYMGCWKCDRLIFRRMHQSVKLDIASRSFKPLYLDRFVMLSIAVIVNLTGDIIGMVLQPKNFGVFLLAVFIANLAMYLGYYSMMKIRFKERIRWVPVLYMILSIVCWSFALHFFEKKNTSWQLTPAESRERNKQCIVLNFYDDHDVWHLLSACGLFFSFMVLFTLDDDLEGIPRSKIHVF